MIANRVVLPAPFGPISAVMRPCSREERRAGRRRAGRRSGATRSRQRLSHGALRRSACAARRVEQSGDAARRERHHEDQHAAVDHEIEARRVAGQVLGDLAERLDHQRAEQRAEHRADAADDRREQRLDRDPRAVGDAGIEEEEILRVEAAARRGDRGRERHRGELDAERRRCRARFRGVLVLAHRDEIGAEAAAFERAARSRARPRRSARMIQ